MKFWKEIKKGLVIASMAIALTGIVGSTSAEASTTANRNSEITTLNLTTQNATKKYYIIRTKTKKFSLKTESGVDVSARATWTSSDKTVARVNRRGLVRGVNKGRAVISATYNGVTYNSLVVVQTPKLSKTTLTITEGKSRKLRLKGNSQEVTWYSKDNSIATVDETGKVTAVSEGKVKIIAQIKDTRYTKSYGCWVTVKPDPNAVTEPETEIPAVNTLEQNYAELKKYITTYGGTNTQGNKLISNKLEQDGNSHISAIVYELATDKLHFLYTYESASGKTRAALSAYIDCTTSSYITPEISLVYESGTTTNAFQSKVIIPAATYAYSTSRNVTFTTVSNTGFTSDYVQDASYNFLFNAMLAWDRDLLDAKAKLSLSDLGFKSYIRPNSTNN